MADSTIANLGEQIIVPSGTEWVAVDDGNGAKKLRVSALTSAGVDGVDGANGTNGTDGVDGVNANIQFVNHGADANVVRPAGFDAVVWYGSVQPLNMVAPDIVIRTDEAI